MDINKLIFLINLLKKEFNEVYIPNGRFDAIDICVVINTNIELDKKSFNFIKLKCELSQLLIKANDKYISEVNFTNSEDKHFINEILLENKQMVFTYQKSYIFDKDRNLKIDVYIDRSYNKLVKKFTKCNL